MDDRHALTLVGIELMTAWLDQDDTDSTDLLMSVLGDRLENPADVIVGLVNVAGSLLMHIEGRGEDPHQVLRDLALRHQSPGTT